MMVNITEPMLNDFTDEDVRLLLESLSYSKRAIWDSDSHPTHEFKNEQLARIDDLVAKVRRLLDEE